MRGSWLLGALALVGCTKPVDEDKVREGPDDCTVGGDTELLILSKITFAREVDGVAQGFDLDGVDSSQGGSTGCGVADQVAPDGRPGIDNAFAKLIPALELTEAAALELIVQEAINTGGLLAMVELHDVEDPWDDACVDLDITGGMGVPMVGSDGFVLAGQTFDRDPDAVVSGVEATPIVDGVLEGGPIDLLLPFAFLDAEVVFHLQDGLIRMERQPEGHYLGRVGGGIEIQSLIDLAANTGINQEVEDLLRTILAISADLDPGPDGTCNQISVTLEVEAIQAFFYES